MSKRKRILKPAPPPVRTEPQTVEMLTVFWMLSVMTSLLCEVGFALARAYLRLVDPTAARMEVLAGMLLFAAAVVGVISLALCAAVVKLRKVPPPVGVIVCGIVIGAIPLVAMALGSLRQD
jgi:hypothetical protein